jgi:hypothetical protein
MPYLSPPPTMQAAKLSSSQPKSSLQTRTNSPGSSTSPTDSSSLLYRPAPSSEVFVVFFVPANNASIFDLDKLTPSPTSTGQTRPLQRSDPGIVGTVASVARNPAASTPLADLPLISQFLTRDSAPSPALALSAAIRDIVFQGYLPTSAAVTANAKTNDRASVIPVSKESGTPLSIDGFIQTSEDSLIDLSAVPGDVVTAEANTINDILRELRDVTSPAQLSPQMQPTVGLLNDADVANVTIDLQTDFSVDEVASIQLDGGMVALQSTGDANASSFDLTPMYAMQVESLAAPVPMEAAVGVYQAIDVAADDMPMTESQPQGATVTPQADVQMQNSSPLKNDRGATRKASWLVGMTALTGAMVWVSRAREQAEHAQLEPLQAAQKRRVLSA